MFEACYESFHKYNRSCNTILISKIENYVGIVDTSLQLGEKIILTVEKLCRSVPRLHCLFFVSAFCFIT